MQEVVRVPALIQMKRPCQTVDAGQVQKSADVTLHQWSVQTHQESMSLKGKGERGYIYILPTVLTCY